MTVKVASVREVRRIEAAADRSVMSYAQMMLKAGEAASAYLQARIPISDGDRIIFLIGKGSNGGDGLVMARDLAEATNASIHLYLLEARDADDSNYQSALEAGLTVESATEDSDGRKLNELIQSADVIVDALFGIGLRPPLRAAAARLLEHVNSSLAQLEGGSAAPYRLAAAGNAGPSARRPFILAIDCPSGIDCDSGDAYANALAADATISFIAAKPGLFTFPAASFVGELAVSTLGLPEELPELSRLQTTMTDGRRAAALLPQRPLDGHKGSFGKVMLVAGSPNYIGAIALAGEAACRSGVGLVTVATTRDLIATIAGGLREPTWLPLPDVDGAIARDASVTIIEAVAGYDALLVGCGLGLQESTRAFILSLLESDALPPLIIDADGLNALSRHKSWWRQLPPETIVTPHSGEMARLTGLSTAQINADRWRVAIECAARWNLVVVLKGAHTIIAAPDGRASVIPFKTDALGTAGTGDILAGLIAGIRGQGVDAFDCACLGAYIHALAGTIAAADVGSSRSVIAGDVLPALGRAFKQVAEA